MRYFEAVEKKLTKCGVVEIDENDTKDLYCRILTNYFENANNDDKLIIENNISIGLFKKNINNIINTIYFQGKIKLPIGR